MAIGCYTPKYLQASYKGIEFKAEDVSSEHGRRGAEGEFPFSENTAYADLGRRIRRYSIRARFDDNDHIRSSQDLINVCEQRGPGLLIHPTRGIVTSAACTQIRVSDKPETEQGVTYVDLEFIEANSWPNGFNLLGSLISLGVGSLIGAASTMFLGSYNPLGIQPFRLGSIVNAAQAQVANIASSYANATISSVTANISANVSTSISRALFSVPIAPTVAATYRRPQPRRLEDIAAPRATATVRSSGTVVRQASVAEQRRSAILYDFDRVINDDYLASQPEVMEKAIRLGMAALAEEVYGETRYQTFRALANGAAKSSTFQPPASTAENSIYSLVRIIAVSYMAQGALEHDGYTAADLYSRMQAIETILEEEMDVAREACNSELYIELANFRVEAVAEIYRKAYGSPGLVQYDFGGRVHPVTAAYSIYGDAKRHRELEGLNNMGYGGRIGNPVTAEVA